MREKGAGKRFGNQNIQSCIQILHKLLHSILSTGPGYGSEYRGWPHGTRLIVPWKNNSCLHEEDIYATTRALLFKNKISMLLHNNFWKSTCNTGGCIQTVTSKAMHIDDRANPCTFAPEQAFWQQWAGFRRTDAACSRQKTVLPEKSHWGQARLISNHVAASLALRSNALGSVPSPLSSRGS